MQAMDLMVSASGTHNTEITCGTPVVLVRRRQVQ
jgi:hypothetical protein